MFSILAQLAPAEGPSRPARTSDIQMSMHRNFRLAPSPITSALDFEIACYLPNFTHWGLWVSSFLAGGPLRSWTMSASSGLMRPLTPPPCRAFTRHAPARSQSGRGPTRRRFGVAQGGAHPSQPRAGPSGSDGIDTDVEAMFRRREQDSGAVHGHSDGEGPTDWLGVDDARTVGGPATVLEDPPAESCSAPRPKPARAQAKSSKAVRSQRQEVRRAIEEGGWRNSPDTPPTGWMHRLQRFAHCLACTQ